MPLTVSMVTTHTPYTIAAARVASGGARTASKTQRRRHRHRQRWIAPRSAGRNACVAPSIIVDAVMLHLLVSLRVRLTP